MSTILNALYKETQSPAYTTVYPQGKSNRRWKIALFIAFLIIIALLSSLLFILLNPPQLAAQPSTQAENVLQSKPGDKPLTTVHTAQQKTAAAKPVSRVLFVTTPMASPAGRDSDENIAAVQLERAVKAPPVATQQQEIDYSHVSAELQQRFERALSVNAQQAKAFAGSESSDGRDIQQMASDFQERVPAISYDFHVYSSLAEERWIRINGEDLKEGQFDRSGNIQVLEIQPQRTVFRFGSQSFSLQSLTDWQK